MIEEDYIIKQISVFSENRPGRLAAVAGALKEAGINIFAFSIAEADGFGVIRTIVDQPIKAHDMLSNLGFRVSFTDVIAVVMRDEPGGLYDIAEMLGNAEINIEYAYAYSGKENAILILRVDSTKEAVKKIHDYGEELLKASRFK